MRICVIGLRGIPGIMGGVETHCEELLPRIVRRRADADITVIGREPYTGPEERMVDGVRLVPLPSPTGKSTEAIVSTWNGLKFARRQKPDLVHIHAIGPALLTPAARLLGLKVVVTHHGADYDRAKWGGMAKAMLRLGEQLGIRFANRVICVSPSLREGLARRFPGQAGKLVYIPNGAATLPPVPTSDEQVLAGLDLKPRHFLLAVARLVPEKGLSYLIDAHARLPDAPPLAIAGAEMHGDGHAEMLKAKAGPNVRFLGARDRGTLGALYRNASLFVMPSYHEGLPIAALEAMASGAPMLLSDIPANLDLGLAAANYFPVGNTDALAQALGGDLGRYAISADCNARFDWEMIADETLRNYDQLVVKR